MTYTLSRCYIVASKDMSCIRDEHKEYILLLSKVQDMRYEMINETIGPVEKKPQWEVHDCDPGGAILSGETGRLEIEGLGRWMVRRGDSFYIKAGFKHRLVNLGKRAIKQITVMDPSRY